MSARKRHDIILVMRIRACNCMANAWTHTSSHPVKHVHTLSLSTALDGHLDTALSIVPLVQVETPENNVQGIPTCVDLSNGQCPIHYFKTIGIPLLQNRYIDVFYSAKHNT